MDRAYLSLILYYRILCLERNESLGMEVEDLFNKGASAHEILATAFKAIRQTTLMMVQTRYCLPYLDS